MLHINTFGSTPAAIYLVKTLNSIDDPSLNKNISRSIIKVSTQVSELVSAYTIGKLSSTTVANSLRLMRLDIPSKINFLDEKSERTLAIKLACNVMISYIKRAGRMCEVAARNRRVMANPDERGIFFEGSMLKDAVVGYVNKDTGRMTIAGSVNKDGTTSVAPVDLYSCQIVNEHILMQRSKKRLARLNKHI